MSLLSSSIRCQITGRLKPSCFSGDVVVLTTTYYTSMSELRFHLATQMVGNAIALGCPVFIVDGSPDPSIKAAFERIGAHVFPQTEKGLGTSRRQLFRIASEYALFASYFLWTEPEKVDIVRFIEQIIDPLKNNEAMILVPTRSSKSFDSYPAPQVQSEQSANAVYAKIMGSHYDIMFGPVALCSSALPYFVRANPSLFGAPDTYIQHLAPLLARYSGQSVVAGPEIDFYYPPIQKDAEETVLREAMHIKRQNQFLQCTAIYEKAVQWMNAVEPQP